MLPQNLAMIPSRSVSQVYVPPLNLGGPLWLFWLMQYGRSNTMGHPRLGHKKCIYIYTYIWYPPSLGTFTLGTQLSYSEESPYIWRSPFVYKPRHPSLSPADTPHQLTSFVNDPSWEQMFHLWKFKNRQNYTMVIEIRIMPFMRR